VPEFSAGIGSALIAAAAVFYVYRSRRSTDKATGISSNEQLLLPVKTSAGGTGGSGEDPGVAALRRQLASEAQYDEASCFPLNTAAKKLTALDWSTGNARSQVSHVVNLPFVELAQATQSFDSFNELGSGGSCDVFRGALFGLQVAVKRLEAEASDWSTKQFTSEMELLTKVAHPHVVRLLAYSTDGPQRCLVLELCTGGTLNDRISCKPAGGQPPPPPLPWQQRVRIALQILLALAYLHSLCPQIIHRFVNSHHTQYTLHTPRPNPPSHTRPPTRTQRSQDTECAAGRQRRRQSGRLRRCAGHHAPGPR
jgi:serine/threonine protein kinase